MDYIYKFLMAFGQLALEMAPWLLMGFVFAGLFKAWFPDRWTERYLSKPKFSSVIWASVLGVPLPLCSCGVLPMAVSLHKKGASPGAVNSFLISTPQTGIDNILATYSLLGLPFAIARPVIAFISGIFGGAVMNWIMPKATQKPVEIECAESEPKSKTGILKGLKYAFFELFGEMYGWLIVGLALAAVLNIVLPDDLSSLFSKYPGSDMFIALLISVPMYICATGSIPVALVLLLKGFSPGAAIVLLMAGPATNIAGIVLLAKSVSVRFSAIYVASITVASLFFGFLANLIFSNQRFVELLGHQAACLKCAADVNVYQIVSLAILTLLILYFLYNSIYQIVIPVFRKKSQQQQAQLRFVVSGMTCKNCSKKVENRLWQEKKINQVNLNLESGLLEVETSLTSARIIEIVKDLGYDCKPFVKGFSYVRG